MYTRAMPYAFGMYAGYLHINHPTYDFTKGTFVFEMFSLISIAAWSVIGVTPIHMAGFSIKN